MKHRQAPGTYCCPYCSLAGIRYFSELKKHIEKKHPKKPVADAHGRKS